MTNELNALLLRLNLDMTAMIKGTSLTARTNLDIARWKVCAYIDLNAKEIDSSTYTLAISSIDLAADLLPS